MLDRALRWDGNDPVGPPWSGRAPDIGVHEYGGGRPAVHIVVERTRADKFVIRPDEPVRMRALTQGIEPVQEIRWLMGDGQERFGADVSHIYDVAGDYPVRVRVTDGDGNTHRATAYLVVETPRGPHESLLHSTFDADDTDWWWLWQTYRPTPTKWTRELDPETGRGIMKVMAAGDRRGRLPARTHVVPWDIDRFPMIEVRYRMLPGTPVGMYLAVQDIAHAASRRQLACVARGANAPEPSTEQRLEKEQFLVDDGNWHELRIDARWIRRHYPQAKILEGLFFEAMDVGRVRMEHGYELDEVIIRPAIE